MRSIAVLGLECMHARMHWCMLRLKLRSIVALVRSSALLGTLIPSLLNSAPLNHISHQGPTTHENNTKTLENYETKSLTNIN
jgi:hypothetical protein